MKADENIKVADKYYKMALERIQSEYPNARLDQKVRDSIWFSIYGMVVREYSEESILDYVQNAPVSDEVRNES